MDDRTLRPDAGAEDGEIEAGALVEMVAQFDTDAELAEAVGAFLERLAIAFVAHNDVRAVARQQRRRGHTAASESEHQHVLVSQFDGLHSFLLT